MGSLLSDTGIQNPSAVVRNRVCHHILRLVKSLNQSSKSKLQPLSGSIAQCLQSLIFKVLERDGIADSHITLASAQMRAEALGVLIGPNIMGNELVCPFESYFHI